MYLRFYSQELRSLPAVPLPPTQRSHLSSHLAQPSPRYLVKPNRRLQSPHLPKLLPQRPPPHTLTCLSPASPRISAFTALGIMETRLIFTSSRLISSISFMRKPMITTWCATPIRSTHITCNALPKLKFLVKTP